MKRWLAVLLAALLAVCPLGAMAEELQLQAGLETDAMQPLLPVDALDFALTDNLLVSEEPEPAEAVSQPNAGDIAIDKGHFPQAEFRAYVAATFDKDGNGSLSANEIKVAKKISIGYEDEGCVPVSCTNLRGIEYLTNLTELICKGCGLTELDVSKNTQLTYLNCCDNQLTALNTGKNTKLVELSCDNNKIKSLDLSNNKKLTGLYVPNNKLTKLNVSKNVNLAALYCTDNKVKTLDLSKNTKLVELRCENNALTSINIGKCKKLDTLDVNNNKLKALDVSNNKLLTYLVCSINSLSALDVSKNTRLTFLGCSQNKLKKLDVTRNAKLQFLDCFDNQLTALNLSKNKKLDTLYAFYINVESIDIKNCPALQARLKMEHRTQDGVIMWGREEEGEFRDYLDIDVGTKLTAGKKVLYEGA